MPLTVTTFLEAAGCVTAGGVVSLVDTVGVSHDLSVGDTTGVSCDVHVADGASRCVSSCVVGVLRGESTKYNMLVTSAIYVKQETAKFLYSAGYNLQDCSKRFTLYFLADLFNRTPSELLRVA